MSSQPLPLRIANALAALLFLLGATVQLNDPDPWRWLLIYAAAAGCCGLAEARRREGRIGATALLVVALGWAGAIFAGGMEAIEPAALISDLQMKTAGVERWREALGLGVIAGWMAVLRRATRPGTRSDPAHHPPTRS